MTVKQRLFWSNILMIIVPAFSAALIGLLCVGFIWLSLINGAGLGLEDREDFDRARLAVMEVVENRIDMGIGLSSLETLMDTNGMSVEILSGGSVYYSYGDRGTSDSALMAAANSLGDDATVTQNGRSVYLQQSEINDVDYQIYIFGGSSSERTYFDIKVALAMSAIIIAFTIFISILLTNRFLTRFVFRRIEEPLDILTGGVHELRDGNLDYRIKYDRNDEFLPICEDFNSMAERLRASVEQIQRQEQSRKELIAGISHDIRSPLTSIQAYVEGLLDGVARTPEAQTRYLSTIKSKAEELEHMVSQLFLFSKMELGEYPEAPRALRLDEAVDEIVSAIRDEYQSRGLNIGMGLEPVTVCADPIYIQRIVTNILENSLKYKNRAQGMVKILLRCTDGGCQLSFADDGPGVPDEALPHLFEVFYRSDPARQNPSKGSGLGLAIVANAVQRSGGTIEALASELGGLEIRIWLPEIKEGDIHGKDSDN